MILGPDGTKLSKRHGAVSVMQYREDGFLPEAVLNYLVRLGWSHGDQEVFSREEMVQLFDITDVNASASAINPQKLLWLNQHYIKTGDLTRLGEELGWHLSRLGLDLAQGPSLESLVKAQQERAKTFKEMAEASRFFFEDVKDYEPQAAAKNLTAEALPGLSALREKLATLPEWTAAALHAVLNATAESQGQKLGKLAQPLRVAVSGGGVSPPIDATLELLGRERTLERLDRAIGYIAKAGR
jgi:glutamyl-tRNA synthetase